MEGAGGEGPSAGGLPPYRGRGREHEAAAAVQQHQGRRAAPRAGCTDRGRRARAVQAAGRALPSPKAREGWSRGSRPAGGSVLPGPMACRRAGCVIGTPAAADGAPIGSPHLLTTWAVYPSGRGLRRLVRGCRDAGILHTVAGARALTQKGGGLGSGQRGAAERPRGGRLDADCRHGASGGPGAAGTEALRQPRSTHASKSLQAKQMPSLSATAAPRAAAKAGQRCNRTGGPARQGASSRALGQARRAAPRATFWQSLRPRLT